MNPQAAQRRGKATRHAMSDVEIQKIIRLKFTKWPIKLGDLKDEQWRQQIVDLQLGMMSALKTMTMSKGELTEYIAGLDAQTTVVIAEALKRTADDLQAWQGMVSSASARFMVAVAAYIEKGRPKGGAA
jgi:hypothetical protein